MEVKIRVHTLAWKRKILWTVWWRFPCLKRCAQRWFFVLLIEPALEWLAIMCLCTETAENKKVERSVFNSVYRIESVKTIVLLELLE